jgi:Cu-Zn family superoxide dismutase
MTGYQELPRIRRKAMERTGSLLALCAGALLLAPLAQAADTSTTLKDKDGKQVGTVTLTNTPNGVLMRFDLTGLSPREHAVHIHAVGKCEPPDFKSAGPHFNPDATQHGLMNSQGPHAGDMPNLIVPDSGKLSLEVLNSMVSLRDEPALLDADGSAIVIHATADDYATDPAGNAGDRVACGVIAP